MADKVRIPFEFHLKSIQCVSPEEAARMRSSGPSSGLRAGPHDQLIPVEQLELHPDPRLDRLMRDVRRASAKQRQAETEHARIHRALATAASLPRDMPPSASRLAASVYQNILPPLPASSPAGSVSSDGATPDAAPSTSR